MDYPVTGEPQPRKKKRRSIWLSIAAGLLVLACWGGLVYAGFYYTKEYVDRSIQRSILEVQETNALQVQSLDKRLSTIHSEVKAIEETLRDTDKTLSKSDLTQKALNEQINALDDQLQRLERSLNILKEAPGADA